MNFYLLGYPLGHSVSPAMHNAAFKELGLRHKYSTLGFPSEQLPVTMDSKLRAESFGGANVTIPYKLEVIQYLDELAQSAKTAGAVNTIENRSGVLRGHNTDALGGIRALSEAYGDLSHAKVVLLGAGGAASALGAELCSIVDELIILNRSVVKARALAMRLGGNTSCGSIEDQSLIESMDILINATPVGMSPKTGESPVDPRYLHSGLLVFDIVYNPLRTKLLEDAEMAGARTLGGLWMLVYQGVEAFKIWTGIEPSADTMYSAALDALEAMKH
ncbi:MAG: shikimate dehydrogenase [Candidatus Bathyarchaeota archaeon]